MAASVRPVIKVIYNMSGGSFASGVSRIYGTLIQQKKSSAVAIKETIRDPYFDWINKRLKEQDEEEKKQRREEANRKMKELQKRTGKTANEIMADWARRRGFSLDDALRVFGGRQNLIEIITGDYSY